MASQPYTDADVALAADAYRNAPCPACGRTQRCRCLIQDPDRHYRIRAALDALTAAGWQKTPTDDPRHIIEFRASGWTLKHPLSCRHGDLWGCAVNRAAEEMDGPPAELGRYAVHVDGIDGRLWVDERVEG